MKYPRTSQLKHMYNIHLGKRRNKEVGLTMRMNISTTNHVVCSELNA